MKETELKPCPFCGGKARITKSNLGTNLIYCTECPTTFGRYWFSKKRDIIKAWNRRADNEQREAD